MPDLIRIITAAESELRDQSLEGACAGLGLKELLEQGAALDAFRRRSENLYERVRALFFLYAIHRFHLPKLVGQASRLPSASPGQDASETGGTPAPLGLAGETPAPLAARSLIPFKGYEHLLQRRFEEAIDKFLEVQQREGPSDSISSALAAAYHRLAFQTLADQVRRSVRSVRGNQWMFRMGHPADQPLRIRPELLRPSPVDGTLPILRECTPVRMDLTHCGWSDIFFLGMDFPEGAKVLNVSIDLGICGRDAAPRPPVEAYLRVIEEPVLRLVSVDLGASADITNLAEVFDFAKDYLGLLKAAVIASGIVPPGIEGSGQSLAELLARIAGPGRGLEVVSNVNNIPKGSRLAVSTTLLAALVSVCMRATSQAASLTGQLQEPERRLVLARALLGEWLGGSGGGWQDSGGVWPGMKLIEGVLASEGDPEFGISRGRLMPKHRILEAGDASAETRRKLQDSLVLVHGGMAQNVGPILEMVTEKYLLRSEAEWKARQSMLSILSEILAALAAGDVRRIGAATTRNFRQPIQAIIPWATNHFTETLIARVQSEFGESFWGFWMLGGMSGGGMGFIFAPEKKALAQRRLQELMSETKRELQSALPFAMEPVVYDFAINERGTFAELLADGAALMPPGYYTLLVPGLLRLERHALSPLRRAELDKFGAACRTKPELRGVVQNLFDVMLPRGRAESASEQSLASLLDKHGFDRVQHEQIRADLKEGRIGLAQNRLPASAVLEDVHPEDVVDATMWPLGSGAGVAPASGASRPRALLGTESEPAAGETPTPLGLAGETPTPLGLAGGTPAPLGLAGGTPAPLGLAGGTPAPLVAPPFKAFDKDRPASISSRRLPHWRQEGATYFVTFRLADALPQTVLQRLENEREDWLRRHPEPRTEEQQDEFNECFREKLDRELDQGYGACVLKESSVADIVEGALRHFDGERYWLGSYVIMPNHVHLLVRPIAEQAMPDILHSWKSFTSHAVGKVLKQRGALWQDESFDHIVRDERQMEKFGFYIAENPNNARLKPGTFRLGGGLATREGGSGGAGVPPASGASRPRALSGGEPKSAAGGTPTPLGLAGGTPAPLGLAGGTPAPLGLAGGTPAPLLREIGLAALKNGEVAVVTLAAGAGSRWTQGAGVVKALHPFCRLAGSHRTFLETHLAKSRRVSRQAGTPIPHIFTTSYLTHEPIEEFLTRQNRYGYEGLVLLSPGRSVGLRMIPTVRDLRFMWEEMPQQVLDEQQQKVRASLRQALLNWARSAGETTDYTDNVPLQCLHPVGHWYEIPNLLRNGVLAKLVAERPQLKCLLLHNIDTLGADVDPALLGLHLRSGACLTFEVITRRLEDRGGGLARVHGKVRLVEGLALPREEAEFTLTYYNSNTCWIDLDQLLTAFALTRTDLADEAKVTAAIRALAARMPTYITLKDVKKRWGHGQEDIFPVTQFEKLWVDMTALAGLKTGFVVVPRLRGQQLKDAAQLDGWLRDGSAAYVEGLCEWS